MSKRWKAILVLMAVCLSSRETRAQMKMPPETRNAALRYWTAFMHLQDTDADQTTRDLLQKMVTGQSVWDEAKLGHLIDKNTEAIEIMQRATKLPECDWGLEYSRGALMSTPFNALSARALARLNALYGMRLAAKGDSQKATDTWLAGIRFSQHLAQGGSLMSALMGDVALLANVRALTQAAQNGTLNAEEKRQAAAVVKALPETGFDWGQAFWYETFAIDVMLREMGQAKDPAAYYQAVMDRPAPANFRIPNAAETGSFYQLMNSVEDAMRLSPDASRHRLKTLQDDVKTLHPFFQDATTSFTRVNDVRFEVQAARQKLLQAVSGK
jgi:hypothetical protein